MKPISRRIIFVFLFFAAIFFIKYINISISSPKDSLNWFPFVIDPTLAIDSPANVGLQVLDSPAGRHGFLRVKDGRFVFEDGTPAKFWGVNLCFSACFPSKETAVKLAERLAFFGFNAVRLHHMDSAFEPEGIFKDICPSSTNYQDKKTGELSPEQLDRLDYFIFQLKKRGIYVNFNLLVSRKFTLADGIVEADKLRPGAKLVSLFDSKMIELQKKYARELLTHHNSYTGLPYNQDPVVALVEITNENSLLSDAGRRSMVDFYRHQLEKLWKEFSGNQNLPLNEIPKDFAVWVQTKYYDEMVAFLKSQCEIRVPITGMGGYWLREMLKSMNKCDYVDTHDYWDHPQFPNREWDDNDFRINNRSMLLDEQLGMVGKILSRTPDRGPYTISEWNHCYPNRFAYETPVLMASKAVKAGWDGLFQFAFCHELSFYSKRDQINNHFDIIANPQQLLLCAIGSMLYRFADNKMTLHIENGVLIIDSPKVFGAVGVIQDKEISFGELSFLSDQDGAVFFMQPANSVNRKDLIIITVSEIKNSGSYWKGEKYEWGKSPTLMKKMGVKVRLTPQGDRFSLHSNQKYKVFSLDLKGSKKQEIATHQISGGMEFSTRDANSCWFDIVST